MPDEPHGPPETATYRSRAQALVPKRPLIRRPTLFAICVVGATFCAYLTTGLPAFSWSAWTTLTIATVSSILAVALSIRPGVAWILFLANPALLTMASGLVRGYGDYSASTAVSYELISDERCWGTFVDPATRARVKVVEVINFERAVYNQSVAWLSRTRGLMTGVLQSPLPTDDELKAAFRINGRAEVVADPRSDLHWAFGVLRRICRCFGIGDDEQLKNPSLAAEVTDRLTAIVIELPRNQGTRVIMIDPRRQDVLGYRDLTLKRK